MTHALAAGGDQQAADTITRGVTKALSDPSVVGDVMAAFDAPTGYDIDKTIQTTAKVIGDVVSGKALADAQTAIAETLASPEMADWATSTDNPFAAREGTGWQRAAEGLAAATDAFWRNPAGFVAQTVAEGGGVARLATDPVGFSRVIVEKIAGPDLLADIDIVVDEFVAPSLVDAVKAAAPALLIPLAAFLPGFIAGTGLAAPWTAGLGGLLGAANPLAHLVGALTTLPGALAGGLATGIPGFIASLLATLPALGLGPLVGIAGGSALALAGLATVIFGTYGVVSAVALAVITGAAVLATVPVFVLAFAIVNTNVLAWPGAFIAGTWPFLFFFGFGITSWFLLTAWIPVVVYALLAIPAGMLGGVLGLVPGTLAGLAAPLLGVPVLTGLSALPGAMLGGVGGYLAGDLATRLVSSVAGAGLGLLAAPVVGGIPGGLLTNALSIPAMLAAALALAGMSLNNSRLGMSARVREALDDINQAMAEGWNRSKTKRLIDGLLGRWNDSDTGGDIAAAQNMWARIGQMLGGRVHMLFDPDAIVHDAGVGGAVGGVLGGLAGALVGGLAGLLDPLNLLGAIPGVLGGVTLGAILGGMAGLIPPLVTGPLGGLASVPVTFLPNLLAATAGWSLLNVPSLLVGLASTLIPSLVLAVSASFIAWLVVYTVPAVAMLAVTVALAIPALVMSNPVVLALTGGALSIPAGLAGVVATGIAIANILGGAALIIPIGVLVGVPVFWLTLPLFIFPAALTGLMWLAGLPLTLPVAVGMSVLEAVGIGSAVSALTGLVTVPAGAGLGGLAGGALGAGLGVLATAAADGLLGATIGAELGSLPVVALGGLIGAVVGWLRSLRIHIDPPVAGLHVDVGAGEAPAPAPVEVPAAMLPDYGIDTEVPAPAAGPVPAPVAA
ncbi:hypothetical protein [Corynebacterium bovis]|uniref:hypothetical protein n=1 Tax=Corynebacterium bovis TaxID=36808 RepID=UPI0031393E61